MPRDIPVGNGQMLVTFDQHYRVRDLYYPHVGQENHAGNDPCRFGVWAKLPPRPRKQEEGPTQERRKARVYWSDDHWHTTLKYREDTLVTDVTLRNDDLQLELRCQDAVDFHRPVLVRRIEVVNLTDGPREARIFSHHDFSLYGTKVGDTAYYDPQLRSLIHYRKQRYLMTCFYTEGDQQIDEYATGTAGFGGHEGTYRDAEDGSLSNNPIAQGAVDSTMMVRLQLPANGMRVVYLIMAAGQDIEDLAEVHQWLHRVSPQGSIDRTAAYWRLWLAASRTDFPDLDETGISQPLRDLFKRSLLLVRTQIDNGGAIIAANDSDIMQFARDTYSYMWPRDGAFVADAVDAAGFSDIARQFFLFCARNITPSGYLLHKYNPDGSPASSWHPWVADGKPQLPIQEDETALVVWSLWRHYVRYRDIEFVRPLWVRLIQPAADFLCRYRDPDTKLPLPSYDLWEERYGVHAFTVATVYGGLRAAWQFAVCFGDQKRAQRYAVAAEEVKAAFEKHFWDEERGHFLRRVMPKDRQRLAGLIAEVMAGREPSGSDGSGGGVYPELDEDGKPITAEPPHPEIEHELDPTLDASMFAIFALGLLPPHDERVKRTMDAIADRLWCKTDVGGVARYEDDYYHQVSKDTDRIPGNPWFICTLWLADYRIAAATTLDELREALEYLEWVAAHPLASGVLAEQVHPETNAPLSVSPLTWSHATFVATTVAYLIKRDELLLRETHPDRPPLPLPGSSPLQARVPTPVTQPIPDLV